MTFSGQMDGLRVDHGALDGAAEGMKMTVNKIDNTLDTLVGNLKPLVEQWDGETKEAFHRCERVWDQSMREMKDLLNQASLAVGQSNAEYRSADLRNASKFA